MRESVIEPIEQIFSTEKRDPMNRHLPPLIWVRAFESAARHMSFTHAARELGLTQSAISKQVRLLEQFLREPLFQRKARSLLLTKSGEAYLPKVHDAFARLSAGTAEVFGQRVSEVLTVRVAVGFSVNWLAPRLPGFFARHPDVRVRFLSSVWNSDSHDERYDLDIRYGTGTWPGMETTRLSWEKLFPLAAPDVADSISTPNDLRNCTLIHVLGYEEGWDTWLRAAGLKKEVNAGLHVDHSLIAYELAASGVGVAIGRTSMVETEFLRRRLVQPFELTVPIREAFYLASPRDASGHPDATRFRRWLIDLVAEERERAPDVWHPHL